MDRLPASDITAVRKARVTRASGSRFEDLPDDVAGPSDRPDGHALAVALADLEVARDRLNRLKAEGEDALRASSQRLEALSHDFRTPIQAMFGYTELLERGVHGPLNEAQLRDVHKLQHSHQHLLGLVNQLLEYSRLDQPDR